MARGRKRKLSYRNDNEQEQDHDEYRSRNNASGFLHNYPSYHANRHLGNVQSKYCNNGGVVLAESSNHHQFLSNGINHTQVQESIFTQEKQENNHQQVLSQPQPPPIKSKASNIFAVSLKIGSWIWESKYAGDLVVKFYYGKKKLVWEFLFGSMKKKIEIRWSHVSAINTYVDEDQNRHLQIELGVPPEYYKEVNFEPLKHTQWEKTNDFTQGQAQCCRRHTILFSPGVLDGHFKKLLQHDNRLFNLSQQPFPINAQFFMNPNMEFSYDVTVVPSVQNLVQPTSSFAGHSNSNLPMPGVAIPNSDENQREAPYVNEETNEEQNGNNQIQDLPFPPINVQEDSQLYDGLEPLLSDRELQLHDVENPNLTNQNGFNVDSTCKPFEQNHQDNSNPSGNKIDDGNHHVGPSHINPGVAFTEEPPSSGGCGLYSMANVDYNICNFTDLDFNDELALQEQFYWASSQLDVPLFNNGGNGEHPFQGSGSPS